MSEPETPAGAASGAGTRRSAAPFGSSRRVAYAALIALGIAVGLATIKWCIAFYYELSPDVMDEAGRRWYHSVMGGGTWFVGLATLVAAVLVVRLAWISGSDRRLIYFVCLMVVGFSLFSILMSHGAWMIPVKGITLFSPRMEKWGIVYLVVTVVVLILHPESLASPVYGAVIAFSIFVLALTWHRWRQAERAEADGAMASASA
ncbi:MAG: hypothetical protein E6Q90_09100 [Actinobacteria bacterium]|nr:MAG: hypothetical protein E6Q90_09100 [Actinomycetota bacterium]